MSGIWHYTDAKGERQAEAFTAAQATLDQSVVKVFESAEANFAAGVAQDGEAVKVLFGSVDHLPAERGKHWLKEFARINLKAPAKPAPAEVKGGKK
jgi:hypothetical protein